MDVPHHAQLFLVATITDTPFDMAALAVESEITTVTADTFSIGEARTLIETAFARPFEKATRIIIVRAQALGIEAQHALLKILEEPPSTTRFIFILRTGCVLLPTVLSRVLVMPIVGQPEVIPQPVFSIFAATAYTERITQIALATKNKDMATLDALYAGLVVWLESAATLPAHLRARLMWCQSMLTLHGASKKMLWEEIALVLPIANHRA